MLSLAEAKRQLNVDTSDSDTLIQDLIYVAQRQVEDYCNLDLTAATWDLFLSDFPSYYIELPRSPVASITHVKYYDSSNVEQTWDASNYYYSIYENPTKVFYSDSASVPTLYEDRFEKISVRFVTGYTSPDAVPTPLKQAVAMALTDLYHVRGNSPREKFSNWHALVYPYRVFHSTTENMT